MSIFVEILSWLFRIVFLFGFSGIGFFGAMAIMVVVYQELGIGVEALKARDSLFIFMFAGTYAMVVLAAGLYLTRGDND